MDVSASDTQVELLDTFLKLSRKYLSFSFPLCSDTSIDRKSLPDHCHMSQFSAFTDTLLPIRQLRLEYR